MKKPKNSEDVCPVCGAVLKKDSLIFHMRKKAVFEVYEAFVGELTGEHQDPVRSVVRILNMSPHQQYIEKNTVTERVFKI